MRLRPVSGVPDEFARRICLTTGVVASAAAVTMSRLQFFPQPGFRAFRGLKTRIVIILKIYETSH
jgi:hypothetical protein